MGHPEGFRRRRTRDERAVGAGSGWTTAACALGWMDLATYGLAGCGSQRHLDSGNRGSRTGGWCARNSCARTAMVEQSPVVSAPRS